MKNKYDIICMALKSAPNYNNDSVLLTNDLCSRYQVGSNDRVIVQNIVAVALDAAASGETDFILAQTLG